MKPAEFADLFRACQDARQWAVANCATMDDAWATARPDLLLCIALHPGVLDDRTLRLFAVWSARQVQHLMTDPQSLAVLDVAERYADGQATHDELEAARAAARAAWAAAKAARDAAGGNATWSAGDSAAAREAQDAAWSAEEAAAWSAQAPIRGAAAWLARNAAEVAARDAAQAAQAAWLRANAEPDWERARKMGGAR